MKLRTGKMAENSAFSAGYIVVGKTKEIVQTA
jgi:hypothetical protein